MSASEKDVPVSANPFVRWFANKPLFFVGIDGGAAVLGGLAALLALKRKKKVMVSQAAKKQSLHNATCGKAAGGA